MKMNKEEINNAIEVLKEQLGTEAFLDELLTALNDDELNENLEHISTMWDIDIN